MPRLIRRSEWCSFSSRVRDDMAGVGVIIVASCCCEDGTSYCEDCPTRAFEVTGCSTSITLESDCETVGPGPFFSVGYVGSGTYTSPNSLTMSSIVAGVGCAWYGCSEWEEFATAYPTCVDNDDWCSGAEGGPVDSTVIRARLCGIIQGLGDGFNAWHMTLWVEMECIMNGVGCGDCGEWLPIGGSFTFSSNVVSYATYVMTTDVCPQEGDYSIEVITGTPQTDEPTGDTYNGCALDLCGLRPAWGCTSADAWPDPVTLHVA